MSLEFLLQAAAATGLQWAVETIVSARRIRQDARRNEVTATREHYLNGCLLSLAVTAFVYVQAMLAAFILASADPGTVSSGVLVFALFGGLTAYLWTVAYRRWRTLFQLHLHPTT